MYCVLLYDGDIPGYFPEVLSVIYCVLHFVQSMISYLGTVNIMFLCCEIILECMSFRHCTD